MKWKKLGQIFNPFEYPFLKDYIGYAQSPQAIVFDHFVRIYFSTRKQTNNGKFVSHIQFIDMDKSFTNIINTSKDTVIELGKLGCFDEHGIFPINVLKHNEKIYAYTSGWSRRISVSVETGIGLAISKDNGLTFKKFGNGPVLSASLNEPNLVVDGFVKVYDTIFHMWYIYGTAWQKLDEMSEPDRTYKIGHATSLDGITWIKEGKQIISDLYEHECQALPTVIKIKNRYHMFFAHRNSFDFRKNKQNAYRIGYAYSDNLTDWVRNDEIVGIDTSDEGWDSDMLCYPHVFECENEIYLLYNGNEFGKYGFGIAKLEIL